MACKGSAALSPSHAAGACIMRFCSVDEDERGKRLRLMAPQPATPFQAGASRQALQPHSAPNPVMETTALIAWKPRKGRATSWRRLSSKEKASRLRMMSNIYRESLHHTCGFAKASPHTVKSETAWQALSRLDGDSCRSWLSANGPACATSKCPPSLPSSRSAASQLVPLLNPFASFRSWLAAAEGNDTMHDYHRESVSPCNSIMELARRECYSEVQEGAAVTWSGRYSDSRPTEFTFPTARDQGSCTRKSCTRSLSFDEEQNVRAAQAEPKGSQQTSQLDSIFDGDSGQTYNEHLILLQEKQLHIVLVRLPLAALQLRVDIDIGKPTLRVRHGLLQVTHTVPTCKPVVWARDIKCDPCDILSNASCFGGTVMSEKRSGKWSAPKVVQVYKKQWIPIGILQWLSATMLQYLPVNTL
eukprot:SM000070S21307  [mRNA]  locus=s70:229454:231296:+ [translate_table: standard]